MQFLSGQNYNSKGGIPETPENQIKGDLSFHVIPIFMLIESIPGIITKLVII